MICTASKQPALATSMKLTKMGPFFPFTFIPCIATKLSKRCVTRVFIVIHYSFRFLESNVFFLCSWVQFSKVRNFLLLSQLPLSSHLATVISFSTSKADSCVSRIPFSLNFTGILLDSSLSYFLELVKS